MSPYEATIGLEVHAELKTHTKMFCGSRNDPNEPEPNRNVCPVCMAHPGTLPVINREAVRHVLRVGVALGAKLADYTEFDRKNYFYPDLPKGYQISQFEYPLVSGGELAGVAITRIHLEEDTASSMHNEATGETTIDYNRAGVPLMELVTEPVMHSAEEAGNFGRALQLLLRALGASDANMEKGEMRVEANVSVAKKGERSTAYVEIKNLNSFRTMERAVAYEIKRQTTMLEEGAPLIKQTLGWDEKKQATFPQRSKEGAADYRYFPDPDLPSLRISEIEGFDSETLRAGIPELPEERMGRYRALGVKSDDAALFVRDQRFGSFFESAIEGMDAEATALSSNYIANDLVKFVRDIETRDSAELAGLPISPAHFKELIAMVRAREVSSRVAKDLLALAIETGESPKAIAKARGLAEAADSGTIEAVVLRAIESHPGVVADVRGGKLSALEFLVGQCMKELRGAADASAIRELLRKRLS